MILLVPMLDILCGDTDIPKSKRYIGYAVPPLGVAAVFAVRAALGISSGSDAVYASVSTHITTLELIIPGEAAEVIIGGEGEIH